MRGQVQVRYLDDDWLAAKLYELHDYVVTLALNRRTLKIPWAQVEKEIVQFFLVEFWRLCLLTYLELHINFVYLAS